MGAISINIRDTFLSEDEFSYLPVRQFTNTPDQEVVESIAEDLDADIEDIDMSQSAMLVNSITSTVETMLQSLVANGSANLLDKIGINKENLEIAQFIINIGQSALSQIMSIIQFIPKNITMVPDSHAALSNIVTSYKDMFMAMYLNVEQTYQQTINEAITNFPSWEEIQKDLINTACDMALDLLNQLCYKYTGHTFVELYYMCIDLINMYKKYKESRKRQREEEQYRKENNIIDESGSSTDLSFDSEHYKVILKNQLENASDLIYNSFIIVTIKDTIMQVKDLIEQMHNIDLNVLTENIKTLDDIINLFDEIGLNDNAWTVDLVDAIKLGINDFQNQLTGLTKQMTALGISAATELAAGAIDDISIDKTKLFDFKSEMNNNVYMLVLTVYSDPYLIKFKNKLSKVLLNAEYNGNKIFTTNDIIKILNLIQEHYEKKEDQELYINNYKFKIHYNDDSQTGDVKDMFSSSQLNSAVQDSTLKEIIDNLQKEQIRKVQNDEYKLTQSRVETLNEFLNAEVTEEYTDDPKRVKKRPTLKLVHDLLALLNKFIPILKTLATLISNYKINKAKVKNHAQGNIFAMIKVLAKVNKLLKELNTTTCNFYTIRTLKLYDYVSDNITTLTVDTKTMNIDNTQTTQLYNYLQQNNLEYRQLTPKLSSVLYIDTEALQAQREELDKNINQLQQYFGEDASLFAHYPNSKYRDGTTIGLNTVEIAGDTVYYSDSLLPAIGSQIMRQLNK